MTAQQPPAATPAFEPVRQPSAVKRVLDQIKNALLSGELKPGQRLPSEMELARQFGVGRSAIREAMKSLEALGVIDILHGNGTYITQAAVPTLLSPLVVALLLSADVGAEFFGLRRMIETGYCLLAAENATATDWQCIEAAAAALERYVASDENWNAPDVDALTQLDLGFHYALLDATHNNMVIMLGRTVIEMFFHSIRNTLVNIGPQHAIASHRRLITAIRGGDSAQIHAAVEASLQYWREHIFSAR
jgi:GntR family transcriptional repressor for pyruvate dehydrogenase complex